MAVFEWLRSILQLPPQPLAVSFLAGGLIVYAGIRIWLVMPKLKALNASREGRQRLQEYLEELGDRGYYTFDHVMDSYGLALGLSLLGLREFSRWK